MLKRIFVMMTLALLLPACTEDTETVDTNLCGNNKVEDGEECDDGNTVDGDGCSKDCKKETPADKAVCGNKKVEDGEECDDGNTVDGDGCSKDCKKETPAEKPVCGNKKVEDGEECDDGNTVDGDGCSKDCKKETPAEKPVCGNNKVEDGEECDDGNKVDGDGCSKDCKNETAPEPSDKAEITPNPGPETKCGDGKHEAGETCDPIYNGEYFSPSKKPRTCKVSEGKCIFDLLPDEKENCGSGTKEDYEECDDGNTADGDGCSRYCKKETDTCMMKNGAIGKCYLVVDGDTLKITVTDDGTECKESKKLTVRLHGIDSPECVKTNVVSPLPGNYSAYACDKDKASDYTDKTKGEKGGYEAGEFVKKLIYSDENKGSIRINCETRSAEDATCLVDATNYRYLAYIQVKKDGKYVDLAEEVVKAGYGMAYTDFTSQRIDTYCAAEKAAVDAKAGVWSYADTKEQVVKENFNADKNRWILDPGHCAAK